MKIIHLLLAGSLLMACGAATEKETTFDTETKAELAVDKQAPEMSSADYSSLFYDFQCDMNTAEIAELLDIPVADLEEQTMPNSIKCNYRYSRNGTYESNLNWGAVPSSKAANIKTITRALKEKENNRAVMGNDIVLSATGDCYLELIPIHGRINIRNENYDGYFQIFYGSKARRTQEQQDEWKVKMTDFANYLLEKYKR